MLVQRRVFNAVIAATKKSVRSQRACLVIEPTFKMLTEEDVEKSYKNAICALNTLMSNATVLEKARKEKSKHAHLNVPLMKKHLSQVGITSKELDGLNVIHVSGTKGKGSTCALVESILRNYGFKTGLYTSPHLISVRERIRINGQPLSKDAFTSSFWAVYNAIVSKTPPDQMPPYFRFLTLMAFQIFLKEKVEVAVLEVGIGGEYDCTNVVETPVVVGVTSLGYDHVEVLGNTIEEIAWNKAGIFKKDVPAFTVKQQYEQAYRVLEQRSQEKNCTLYTCPEFASYKAPNGYKINVSLEGEVQQINASLALQLSKAWLQSRGVEKDNMEIGLPFLLSEKQYYGITSCRWPGRFQTVIKNQMVYFLDGAHTVDSLKHCWNWFHKESMVLCENNKTKKLLLFNSTGYRDAENFLRILVQEQFDIALFSTNSISLVEQKTSEQTNFSVPLDARYKNVEKNCTIWDEICKETGIVTPHKGFACLEDAISWIESEKIRLLENNHADVVHVLVTGSLHLVGNVLSIIHPQLDS